MQIYFLVGVGKGIQKGQSLKFDGLMTTSLSVCTFLLQSQPNLYKLSTYSIHSNNNISIIYAKFL